MNWIVSTFSILLVITTVISKKIPNIQIANIIDPEIYVLNLHFDHCQRPKTFSWVNLKCECPLPLIEENGDCSCDGCFYQDIRHMHSEGRSEIIPRFISEIFEEIHEEMENIKENDKNATENGDIKNESILNDNVKRENDDGPLEISNVTNNQLSYQENVTHSTPTTVIENANEGLNLATPEVGLRMFSNPSKRTSKTSGPLAIQKRHFVNCKRRRNKKKTKLTSSKLFRRRSMNDVIQIEEQQPIPSDSSPPKVVKSSKLDRKKFIYFKLKSGHKAQSYSGSVVSGFRSGNISTGEDMANGLISTYRGTGALSLGTGGGSAGGAAFTGIGKSNITVNSKGTSASGFSLIGKNGKEGVSTSSLLLGTGEVIAVNSLAAKGSASGVGLATQNTAGAATSAFGPASASVSAAVGKGGAHSATSFNKSLLTSAGVERQGETVVESSAVGNPNQDIAEVAGEDHDFVNIPEEFLPYNYDFDSIFSVSR